MASSNIEERFESYIERFGINGVTNDNGSYIYNGSEDYYKKRSTNNGLYITNNKETTQSNDFKTKNGTLTVDIRNQKISFNKITFSLGGQHSRGYSKPGFNLKIRGGKELFGRRQFKLRGDATEPSYMRSKLMSDIHNRLGLPSLSANYILLYINDEFMGLYILTDVYKESWIEYVYGEKDTKNLYKCEDCLLTYDSRNGFENENKEATDKQELYKFLEEMTKANSLAEVESIFDIDQFYKEIAIEFLSSSFDHYRGSHNFYIYKNPQNNKWIYLIHDFDFDLASKNYGIGKSIREDFEELFDIKSLKNLLLLDIDHFIEILKEIIIKAFNPATLFPRIDEIKSFIRPYVQLDKTPNEDGQYPGRINRKDDTFFSMEQWEASTEFDESVLGLKKFILSRYKFICEEYGIECDPNCLNGENNLPLNITEPDTETTSILISTSTFDSTINETTTSIEDTILPTTITTSISDSTSIETTTSIEDAIFPTTISIEDTILPTTTTINSTIIEGTTSIEDIVVPTVTTSILSETLETETETETLLPTSEIIAPFKCLSEFIGYPCCPSNLNTIYAQDDYGDWGYDFNKNEWCGLTKYEDSSYQNDSNECWSEKLGYPCCKGCKIYEKDSEGSWGYEFNQWCGIISSHC